jgi:uncharacterized repeat protein (TIGR01451 family)
VGATGSDAVSFTDTVPYKWLFQYRVAACNAEGCAYSEVIAVEYWVPGDLHVPYNILVTATMYAFGESITVPENLDLATFIGVISSSDDTLGGDPQTYSLWSPPDGPSFCNDWFYIRWKLLFLKKPFDYETKPEICVINIQARDTHGNFRTDHVVVNVADEDESPWNIRLSSNTVYENRASGMADLHTDDEIPAEVNFAVSDQDTPSKYLRVSAKSDNPAAVPDANIAVSGTGENRTLTLTPVPGASGTANITVFVSDGSSSGSTSFQLTVTKGPDLKAEIWTDSGTAAPGDILSFTAVISNTGDRTAENVSFTVPVPENTEFVSGTASAGSVLRQSRGGLQSGNQ